MAFLNRKYPNLSVQWAKIDSRAKIAGFSTNEYLTMNKERRELD